MPDDPQSLLSPAIRAARTPAQMEALAGELERIASLTRATAAALRRQEKRPASERVTPRKAKAGRGRAPSAFIRIVHEPWGKGGRDRLRLYVGRALFYALGSPKYINIQSLDSQVVLTPGSGYAVAVGKGMPRFFCDGSQDILSHLDDGRYDAEVRGDTIIIGSRLTE